MQSQVLGPLASAPSAASAGRAGALARLSRADAERLKKVLEARRIEMDLAEREGRLIDARECQESTRAFMGCVARAIHGAPPRLAAAIVSELKLDTAAYLKIKAILEREADQTVELIIADAQRILLPISQRWTAKASAQKAAQRNRSTRS